MVHVILQDKVLCFSVDTTYISKNAKKLSIRYFLAGIFQWWLNWLNTHVRYWHFSSWCQFCTISRETVAMLENIMLNAFNTHHGSPWPSSEANNISGNIRIYFGFSFALYLRSKQLGNIMLSFYNRQCSMSILYRRTSLFSKGRGQRTNKLGGGILHASKTGRRRYSFFNVMLVLVISRACDFVLYQL